MDTGGLSLSGSWDCHLHIFDPDTFPWKPNRTYTPAAAPLDALFKGSSASNYLIVQASVEGCWAGIIHHLQQARRQTSGRGLFRAEIEVDADEDLDEKTLQQLHEVGVRALRLHGEVGVPSGENRIQSAQTSFKRLGRIAKKTGWFIAGTCPLGSWLELGPWLVTAEELDGVRIIIEHSGRLDPGRDVDDYPEFERFLQLLEDHPGKLFVKLCGINRLDSQERADGRMPALPATVVAIAQRVPDSVVWGSDWPHCRFNEGYPREQSVSGKKVDLLHELNLLQAALSPTLWKKLMCDNPKRMFE
ncbi:uncharacterized protein N7498_007292 [Penicillium cinerascens]|uniref:Amidohydrolase-related domain-containing protein n=1 Tax=Penicillium cinerascens TaxID=70096 RepID=A0A9W9MD85_9EURO|nr:uncharacterized protein N7498_007292 [Penicillium cinerascens]KAJ5198175.1 hypothetical protein N7498_007292 [Penicillium cinerascens]